MNKALLKIKFLDRMIYKLDREKKSKDNELKEKYHEKNLLTNELNKLINEITDLNNVKSEIEKLTPKIKKLKSNGFCQTVAFTLFLMLISTGYMALKTQTTLGVIIGIVTAGVFGIPIGTIVGFNDYFELKKSLNLNNIEKIDKKINRKSKEKILIEKKLDLNKEEVKIIENEINKIFNKIVSLKNEQNSLYYLKSNEICIKEKNSKKYIKKMEDNKQVVK